MDCTVPPGAITSVNGVRVLSMWWVILGHTYLWLLLYRVVSKLNHVFFSLFVQVRGFVVVSRFQQYMRSLCVFFSIVVLLISIGNSNSIVSREFGEF